MQYRIFTIPIWDDGEAREELNRFLRGNKILEVDKQLVNNPGGACWCFCVSYLEKSTQAAGRNQTKRVDYKLLLDEETFQKFSRLREIRKQVAAAEALPAYAIFTDEELAGLAQLENITPQTMLSVKGIGDKKVERFAKYFVTEGQTDEASGTPD